MKFNYLSFLLITSTCIAEQYTIDSGVSCCYTKPQRQSTITTNEPSIPDISDSLIIHTEEQKWPVEFASEFNNTEQKLTNNRDDGTVSIDEVNLGFRKDWSLSNLPFAPYLGGGVAVLRAEHETNDQNQIVTDSNRAVGNWYQAGALFDITDRFSFSINMEVNNTELDINGENIKSKELQTGISTIFKW